MTTLLHYWYARGQHGSGHYQLMRRDFAALQDQLSDTDELFDGV